MDVTQILKQFNVDPDKAQQAWAVAKQMGAGVHTKEQALKVLADKGIDKNALNKISGYLKSPMAGVVASMAGGTLEKIRADFNSLIGSAPTTKTTSVDTSSDKLAKYKNALRQL